MADKRLTSPTRRKPLPEDASIQDRVLYRASQGEAEEPVTVFVTVPQDLALWLSIMADRERVSKSDFIREILDSMRSYRAGIKLGGSR